MYREAGRQGGITRLTGSSGAKLGGLGAYTIPQCQRMNLFASGAERKVGGSGSGSPCHMARSRCAPGGYRARLFHYLHPLVLANVMHEYTYHTLASHADTCRPDSHEIGRACTACQGNFLAAVCGGGGMVGANTHCRLINSISPTALPLCWPN